MVLKASRLPMRAVLALAVAMVALPPRVAAAGECTVEAVRQVHGERRARFMAWLDAYDKEADKTSPPPHAFKGPEPRIDRYSLYVVDIDNDGREEYVLTDEDVPPENPDGWVKLTGWRVFRPSTHGWTEVEEPDAVLDPLGERYTDPVSGKPLPLFVRFCGKTYITEEGGTELHRFREALVWEGDEIRPACDAAWLREQRRLFQSLFDHQLYHEAHAFLEGVRTSCRTAADPKALLWMRSDLALAAYRVGRFKTCLDHVTAARISRSFPHAGGTLRRALAANAALCSEASARPASLYDFSWLRELEGHPDARYALDPRFRGLMLAVAPDARLEPDGEALGDRLELAMGADAKLVDDRYVILSGTQPHHRENGGSIWIDLATGRSLVTLEGEGPEGLPLAASTTLDSASVPRKLWEQLGLQPGARALYFGPDKTWRKIRVPSAASPSLAQAQPQRIRFGKGQSSIRFEGQVEAAGVGEMPEQEHVLAAKAGQRLQVRLATREPEARLAIYCPGGGKSGAYEAREVSFTVPQSGDYIVRVEGEFNSTRGFAYSLAVGVTGQAAPAPSGGVSGHYEGDSADVEVRELPGGKLAVKLGPHAFLPGPVRPHIGPDEDYAHGVAPFAHGIATLTPSEQCSLKLTFTSGRLSIEQEGSAGACGFGSGVTVAGDYRRTSLCSEPERASEH